MIGRLNGHATRQRHHQSFKGSAMQEIAPILVSVVIPWRNYDRSIADVLPVIARTVAPLVSDYEIIVIDNGSTDNEFADYHSLVGEGGLSNLQIYRLIQRVEEDTAAWAGVENSLGDYVLVFNPRLEDLSRLGEGLQEITRGRDVVYFSNTARPKSTVLEGLFAPLFRWLFRRVTGIDLALDATRGRLISKRVVSYLLQQPRPGMRYRALPSISGFSKTTLTYSRMLPRDPERNFPGRARAAINLLISNSMAPLRMASSAALLGAAVNVLYSLYVVAILLVKHDVAAGWTTLSLQISGMFFLISLVLFVLTEYLIQVIRWNVNGPSYFLASEATSAVLTRRQKLNVERAHLSSSLVDPVATDV